MRTCALDSHTLSTLASNGGKAVNFPYSTCKISFMLSNDDMLMIYSSCFISDQSCSMLPWCHTSFYNQFLDSHNKPRENHCKVTQLLSCLCQIGLNLLLFPFDVILCSMDSTYQIFFDSVFSDHS